MKIIINEDQLRRVIETSNPSLDSHPAEDFDKRYGTKLSKKYNFTPYTEKELQKKWDNCVHLSKCVDFKKSFHVIKNAFPYIDYSKLKDDEKYDIMCGMLSRYNPEDIILFSIKRVYGFMNHEQTELRKKLPPDVVHHMQWVMSKYTLQKIKEKFSII